MRILGSGVPEESEEKAFSERMESLADSPPRVIFVDSGGGTELETESDGLQPVLLRV